MQYLVTFDSPLDNVPIRVFSSKREAKEFAATLPADPTPEMEELIGADISEGCCISIFTINKRGYVVKREVARDFDEEYEAAESET